MPAWAIVVLVGVLVLNEWAGREPSAHGAVRFWDGMGRWTVRLFVLALIAWIVENTP